MGINTSLLVSAAVLQDLLVDKTTGEPLANGVVTLYQDSSRTTLKNWYYQTGTSAPYTYTTLPNPLVLSAVGTINDGNGNDVIPFYYPYSELDNETLQLYYITVDNANGQRQFTRQGFPAGAFTQVTPFVETASSLKNYVINNVFWRNIGTLQATVATGTITGTIAPSSHDGYSMPDWTFSKSATGANDVLTFTPFTSGQFLNSSSLGIDQNLDVTPPYFLNFTCTGTGPETSKYIQVPLSLRIKVLESVPVVLRFYARCNSSGGTNGNVISASIYQFAGTGTSSSVTYPVTSFTIPVNGSSGSVFTLFEFPFLMPSAGGIAVNGLDDATYLQINFPLNQTFNIDIAKIEFYIGSEVSDNDLDTFDMVDSIICTPRTGDIRQSMNNYSPFGWVPLNNGSIGSASSGATNRANSDTWPLYNLLYGAVNQAFVPVSGYTGNAYTDFTANRAMTLTSALGNILMGVPAALTATYNHATTPSWNQTNYAGSSAVAGLFTLSGGGTNTILYPGAPVVLSGTLPASGAFTAGTVYYAIPDPTQALSAGTTFQLATTYANAIAVNAIAAVGTGNGGTMTVTFALGGNYGQATHLPQTAELVSHVHPPLNGTSTGFLMLGGTNTNGIRGNNMSNVDVTTGSTGNSQYQNLVNPVLYTNIFIKL
jgi:hypothetical protein